MFRKNWNRRHAAGFTLVELIVVIAILAILAGVAVPAYSGYIAKANKAADLQLLGAINTSFGAAAFENQVSVEDISSAEIKVNEDGSVGDIADVAVKNATMSEETFVPSTKFITADELAKLNASFDKFFAGNEGAKFKVIVKLKFNPATGTFDGLTDETSSANYGGGKIVYTQADVETMKDSTFLQSESLGVDKLLTKVDEVTIFANLLKDGAMGQVYNDKEFLKYAAEAMDMKDFDPTNMNSLLALDAELAEMGRELMKKDPTITSLADAKDQIKANAAVLYAAKNAQEMDKSTITSLLNTGDPSITIKDNLTANPGKALSEAALAYGMYTAFAHSEYASDDIDMDLLPGNVLMDLKNPDFQAYMNSPQGQKDLDAYLAALNTIDNSAEDKKAVSNLLINGYNDQELKDLMNGILGQ